MKLRAPAYPLITVDPYFSVWSMSDTLCGKTTCHWTGKPNTMIGTVRVDGIEYAFMGMPGDLPCLRQTECEMTALSTRYGMEGAGIRLSVCFTTPLLTDDLKLLSRPVSYLALSAISTDGKIHETEACVSVSEEICLNVRGQYPVQTLILSAGGYPSVLIGSREQPVLAESGDDLRIDWGYFYLTAPGGKTVTRQRDGMTWVEAVSAVPADGREALFVFAYDDVCSIDYFGRRLKSLWNRDGTPITEAIAEAVAGYGDILRRCGAFDRQLREDARQADGEEYADLLCMVYRQTIEVLQIFHKPAMADFKLPFA